MPRKRIVNPTRIILSESLPSVASSISAATLVIRFGVRTGSFIICTRYVLAIWRALLRMKTVIGTVSAFVPIVPPIA